MTNENTVRLDFCFPSSTSSIYTIRTFSAISAICKNDQHCFNELKMVNLGYVQKNKLLISQFKETRKEHFKINCIFKIKSYNSREKN